MTLHKITQHKMTQHKKTLHKLGRRDFVGGVLAALGAAAFSPLQGLAAGESLLSPGGAEGTQGAVGTGGFGFAGARESGIPKGPGGPEALTIRQVIDLILAKIPGAPFPQTVDTIKAGNPDQPVKGIVTTMFATDAVIADAIRLNANFIIAHEPTYYNHLDQTEWLAGDPVYQYKKDLLEKHGIVVWRFHDSWHSHRPDGILMGVLVAMGWDKYYDASKPHIVSIPPASLENIIRTAKQGLGIEKVKVIGDLSQVCKRILMMPGAAGGTAQIKAIRAEEPDLLLCGELNEWETSEYIRDFRYQGGKTALVDLGHSVSEEPGMEWLVSWLEPKVPGVRVTHVPSGEAFRFL